MRTPLAKQRRRIGSSTTCSRCNAAPKRSASIRAYSIAGADAVLKSVGTSITLKLCVMAPLPFTPSVEEHRSCHATSLRSGQRAGLGCGGRGIFPVVAKKSATGKGYERELADPIDDEPPGGWCGRCCRSLRRVRRRGVVAIRTHLARPTEMSATNCSTSSCRSTRLSSVITSASPRRPR